VIDLASAGDCALLVNLGEVTAQELRAAAASVREVPGVLACIPGHSSLYVIFDGAPDGAAVRAAIRLDGEASTSAREHTIAVTFDGEDLDELLRIHGLSLAAFLTRVDGLRLTARYLGFRGGFAYLDGWPEGWAMPRRPTSRPVRRGAFAIAGDVAGFYPIDTPGGWNLLGRTSGEVEHRFAAGDEIVIRLREAGPARARDVRTIVQPPEGVELLASPLTNLIASEDWSRVVRGLSPGGPFDDVAAALANKAAGNAANAPLFEAAMVWPRLRFHRHQVVAWCGPDGVAHVQRMHAGEEWELGRIIGGLRGYVAIGDEAGASAAIERGDRRIIRMLPGPHDINLREVTCEVTPQLDRVGIRLKPLTDMPPVPADLKSIGMQCGTVQLHPDGSLVAMGPDHPVTGGYLQPMTVLRSERWKLAQLLPGERITLRVD
jgi:allophanate hydrolase subunit 1